MSKITNKWDYLSEKEKKKAMKELDALCRSKQQENENIEEKIQERIQEIRKLWPMGVK